MGMVIQHESMIGRGRSNLLWRGIDRQRIDYDPSYGYGVFNDFTKLPLITSTGTGATITQKTAGTITYPVTTRFGIMLATSSGTDAQGIQYQESSIFNPVADGSIYYETRLSVSGNSTPGDIFIGLHNADTTILNGTIVSGSEFAGFRGIGSNTITPCHAAASSITAVTATGATTTFPDYGAGLTEADTFVKLGFHICGTRRIEYFINGLYVGGSTATIPTATSTATTIPTAIPTTTTSPIPSTYQDHSRAAWKKESC